MFSEHSHIQYPEAYSEPCQSYQLMATIIYANCSSCHNISFSWLLILGDNTDQNEGWYLVLGAQFGLKPKTWLSYFLEMKNYG